MDVAAAFLAEILGTADGRDAGNKEDFGGTGAEEGMVRLFINIGKKPVSYTHLDVYKRQAVVF